MASTELLRARQEALERIADLRRELADVIDSASSTTGDDEHDPEGATIGFERAQAGALLDAALDRLTEIDAAVARDSDLCARCGRPIGAERLAARPGTDRCVECATSDGRRASDGRRRGR